MRTEVEIKLLQARQTYRNHLRIYARQSVISLTQYRIAFLKFWLCTELLNDYRSLTAYSRRNLSEKHKFTRLY